MFAVFVTEPSYALGRIFALPTFGMCEAGTRSSFDCLGIKVQWY